jgi:hypothetical protein
MLKSLRSVLESVLIEVKKEEPRVSLTRDQAILLGEKVGVDFTKVDIESFIAGMNVELEHGSKYGQDSPTNITDDDLLMTAKIVAAHLKESPKYYVELKKMEKKLAKENQQ